MRALFFVVCANDGDNAMPAFEIASAITALKTVRDIVRVGIDAKADAQAQARVIEVMQKLGVAQDTLYELRDELFRLQGEVERLTREADDRGKLDERLSQYSLFQSEHGATVYKFNGHPAHYACPACINQKRIEILQKGSGKTHNCPSCNATFFITEPPAKAMLAIL